MGLWFQEVSVGLGRETWQKAASLTRMPKAQIFNHNQEAEGEERASKVEQEQRWAVLPQDRPTALTSPEPSCGFD